MHNLIFPPRISCMLNVVRPLHDPFTINANTRWGQSQRAESRPSPVGYAAGYAAGPQSARKENNKAPRPCIESVPPDMSFVSGPVGGDETAILHTSCMPLPEISSFLPQGSNSPCQPATSPVLHLAAELGPAAVSFVPVPHLGCIIISVRQDFYISTEAIRPLTSKQKGKKTHPGANPSAGSRG